MVTPTGEEIPATGRHGEVRAVQVFEFEDGKVKKLRSYFDLLTVLTQLGIGAPTEAGVSN
jgi:ketosteroid isomerase-like protein